MTPGGVPGETVPDPPSGPVPFEPEFALQLLVALGGRGLLVLVRAGEACDERSREQEVLAFAGRLLVAVHQREYFLHLAEVALLDHAVGLVYHQIAYVTQRVQVLVALLFVFHNQMLENRRQTKTKEKRERESKQRR